MREEDGGDVYGMGYLQPNLGTPTYDRNPLGADARQRMGSDGRVDGARFSVQRVHEEMRDVESVLLEMERENAENQTKLLAQRHLVFEKYFMVTGHLILQGVIGEWKAYVQQAKHDAEADGLTLRQQQAESRHESDLMALDGEAKALRQLCQQTRAETELQVAPLRAAREEANLRAEQLEAVITSMGEVAARVTALADQAKPGAAQPLPFAGRSTPAQLTEITKSAIHDILRDLDPNYVPTRVVVSPTMSQVSPMSMGNSLSPVPNAGSSMAPATFVAGPPITTMKTMPNLPVTTTTIRPMGATTTTVLPQMRPSAAVYSVAREQPRM